MSGYISREEAKNKHCDACDFGDCCCNRNDGCCEERRMFDEIPAADVQPMVRGENIGEGHPADDFKCSICGIILRDWNGIEIDEYGEKEIYEYTFNFCPNCGAYVRNVKYETLG